MNNLKNWLQTVVAATLVAGMAFAAGPGPARARLLGASYTDAMAQAASGFTWTAGVYSLAAGDVDIAIDKVLYLDGSTRVQGIGFATAGGVRIFGNQPLTPNNDQAINLGSTTIRWSNIYAAVYNIIVGTSSSYATAVGILNTNTTAVGNVGASGPDTLQTYTLPANGLVTTGKGFRVRAWGTTANNANAKSVRLAFGSAALITKQLTASIAGTWDIEAYCIRTGASAQDCYAVANNSGGTTVAATDGATVMRLSAFGAQTQTETGTLVIETQSTVSTSNNDIVSEGLIVEYF